MDKPIQKKTFYLILVAMEAAILLLAFVIAYFRNVPILEPIFNSFQLFSTIFALISGLLIGFLPYLLTRVPPLDQMYDSLINSLVGFKLNIWDCVLISLLAGVCEELLFRGILQSWWGLWISSFVFVLIHGYWSIFDWRKNVLGLVVFLISIIAGLFFKYNGLISAITFHFACDFTAFCLIKRRQESIK